MTPSNVVALPVVSSDQHRVADLDAAAFLPVAVAYSGPALRTSDAPGRRPRPPDDLIVVLRRLVI